jgi:hypothetical protein
VKELDDKQIALIDIILSSTEYKNDGVMAALHYLPGVQEAQLRAYIDQHKLDCIKGLKKPIECSGRGAVELYFEHLRDQKRRQIAQLKAKKNVDAWKKLEAKNKAVEQRVQSVCGITINQDCRLYFPGDVMTAAGLDKPGKHQCSITIDDSSKSAKLSLQDDGNLTLHAYRVGSCGNGVLCSKKVVASIKQTIGTNLVALYREGEKTITIRGNV